MSDMELSVAGEEGELSEEYIEGGQMYEEGEEQGKEEQNIPFDVRQGENHVDKGKKEPEHRRMVDITRDKPVKVTVRVVVPVRDHPKFNFVGKLLGPKGNSLKRLQEDTMTKMAILGRGSMKDKHKEEELRLSGDPKFSHLHDDLHVEITAFAPPAEAHARIAYALADVRRFLVPDYNDDIRQEQMWEMQILKERPENAPMGDNLGFHVLGATMPMMPTTTDTPSPTNSNRSQSPRTPHSAVLDPAAAPVLLPPQHPALRGVPVQPALPPVPPTFGERSPALTTAPGAPFSPLSRLSGTVNGRKRPFFSGSSRHSFSPTKRTVMSILARARASQAKQIPGYHVNGSGGSIAGIRQDGAVIAANLL